MSSIVEPQATSIAHPVTLAARVCAYRRSHPIRDAEAPIDASRDTTHTVTLDGATWAVRTEVASHPVSGAPGERSLDLQLRFRLVDGVARKQTVGLSLRLDRWSTAAHVVLPSAVYNGNRFRSVPIPYPPMFPEPYNHGPDTPAVITDVPRLNPDWGVSKLTQLTRDLATPAAGCWWPGAGAGLWLLTTQGTDLGDSGFEVEESVDRSQAWVRLTAPGVREGSLRWGRREPWPAEDEAPDFERGQEVTLRARLYLFDCPDVPQLYRRFLTIRKDLAEAPRLRHDLPLSAAFDIGQRKHDTHNWSTAGRFYGETTLTPNACNRMQVGWVGGLMVTYPLLLDGPESTQARARQNLDAVFEFGLSPAGLFRGFYYSDGTHREDGFDVPSAKDYHLIRKSADGLYFVLKHVALLRRREPDVPPPRSWIDGARRVADTFVRLWDVNAQFGQFVDAETGHVEVGGSAAGSTAPAALALAHQYLGGDDYLRVAAASAEDFYRRFTRAGYQTGGPGEILQCPDSESAYNLLESFVVLFEVTGDRRWLAYAEDQAAQCATWNVSYDFRFPPQSLFGRLDMLTTGAVFANVQNKHGSPGICTLSGNSLFKLYRHTGNPLYLDLLRETAHNITQYMSRPDRRVGSMRDGWMTERVNLSDTLEGTGEIFEGSCWCETSCLLTFAEVPGLYVRPDNGTVVAIDHIDAVVEEHRASQVRVRLTNPTRFDARVKVLVEREADLARPLGQDYPVGLSVVSLPAGQTRTLTFE